MDYPVTHLALTGEDVQQTDQAWDAIHRCLADGTLAWAGGDWPQPWFRARVFALPAHGYQGRTDEAAFDYT